MTEGMSEAQIVERLLRLEKNVRLIAEHANIAIDDPGAGVDPDVVALARAGELLQAAKLYVERTGADIVTAKRVVTAL